MKRTYDIEVEEEKDFTVEFTAEPHKEDDGIGAYEFWGMKGHDSQPYISCERSDITWKKELHSDEQNKQIEQYLEKNYETIETEFCKEYEDNLPDKADFIDEN